MGTVRRWKPGRRAVDAAVAVAAALVTTAGSWDRVAAWLPHAVIVPLALGQGLLLLARRRYPTAVLAGVTPLGAFMLAAGYPSLGASTGMYCAAYAVAVYGRDGGGAEAARTLRSAAAVLIAALTLALAGFPRLLATRAEPGARTPSERW